MVQISQSSLVVLRSDGYKVHIILLLIKPFVDPPSCPTVGGIVITKGIDLISMETFHCEIKITI